MTSRAAVDVIRVKADHITCMEKKYCECGQLYKNDVIGSLNSARMVQSELCRGS